MFSSLLSRVMRGPMRVPAILCLVAGFVGCGDGLEGTYHGPEGGIVVELKRDHAATVTFMGQTQSCTYDSTKEQITLSCPANQGLGATMVSTLLGTLRRNADGTLSSGLGVLAKRTAS